MGRALQNILRKQQAKIKVNSRMAALLMELAKADDNESAHKKTALIIKKWLKTSTKTTTIE